MRKKGFQYLAFGLVLFTITGLTMAQEYMDMAKSGNFSLNEVEKAFNE